MKTSILKLQKFNSALVFSLLLLINFYTFGQTEKSRVWLKNDVFVLKTDNKVYLNGSTTSIADSVEALGKDNGRVTNSTTGEGNEDEVVYIKRTRGRAKVYLSSNFNTDYLKQKFTLNDVNLNLYGKQVFNGNNVILENCDILRNENGYTVSNQLDGTTKLYLKGKWIDINQIITVNSFTYYIQNTSAFRLDGDSTISIFSNRNATLLMENNNLLVIVDDKNQYWRWEGGGTGLIIPKFVSVKPEIIDEGFWFFMQPKSLLNSTNVIDHKKGLAKSISTDKIVVDTIPATGNCDRFLWRTVNYYGSKLFVNKAGGSLKMNDDGSISFITGNLNWDFSNTLTKANSGTNAYQITNKVNKTLSYSGGEISAKSKSVDGKDIEQIWVLQFNQMVEEYFLPQPTDNNLKKYFYADNDTTFYKLNNNATVKMSATEVQALKIQMQDNSKVIQKTYNKYLKGDNGVNFFATNTTSDWAIVNYYFVLNNIMNAIKQPKTTYNGVNTFDLSVMNGRNVVIINKNDGSAATAKYFFSKNGGKDEPYISNYRGGSSYVFPYNSDILTSEELTCKTGIVNRPLDNSFRRFDHGIHEFGHALQELGRWNDILRKMVTDSLAANTNASNANSIKNSFCWDFADNINAASPECICWMIQKWFNSAGSDEYYPTKRTDNKLQKKFMEIIFNKDNTWMPPKVLRKDGYLPSGSSLPFGTYPSLTDTLKINSPTNIKDLGNKLGKSYTKSAWIKLTQQPTDSKNNILSGKNNDNAKHAFWIPNDWGFRLAAGHNDKWDLVKSPSPLKSNKWYHVAVTYSANTKVMTLYLDGIRVDKNNKVEPYSQIDNNPITIGGYDGSYNFNGQITNVVLWYKALSDMEIKNLYETYQK